LAGFEVTLYGRFWVTPEEGIPLDQLVNDLLKRDIEAFHAFD